MFKPRRILVAGPMSVIGHRVVDALAAGSDAVFGLADSDRSAEFVRALGASPIPGDALDRSQVFGAVAELRPDVVIHLTALPTTPLAPPRLTAELPRRLLAHAGRNLAAAAEAHGVERLVAQSIAFAYRPEGPWIVDESAPLDTGARGAWGEIVTAAADLEETVLDGRNFVGVVLRYGALYGPETAVWRDGDVARLAERRRLPIIGGGGGMHSFIHIDDAAGATLAALDGAAGVYNVVDDDPAPGREWIPAFAQTLGAPPPRRMPARLGRLVAGEHAVRVLTAQRGASNARIRTELGWRPEHPDWRSGFAGLANASGGATG